MRWLDRLIRRDRLRLPPLSQLGESSAMPKLRMPTPPRPPPPDEDPDPKAIEDRPSCHNQKATLDPIALNEIKLQFLEDQANRADSRITELNNELLMHRGGSQHLGHVIGLIDAHRSRLGEHGRAKEAAGTPLEGPALAEHLAQLAGVVDALALLRNQATTAEMSGQRAEAALQEMSRHRADLSMQGRSQAGKVGQLMAELAAGTPREMVGRPEPAESVRSRVDQAKAAEETIVGKRKTVRLH